jgi:SAM-dependent methyltransferase
MNAVGAVHGRYVFGRRVQRIARTLAELIPANATVLDVGCGDGKVGSTILALRSDLEVCGIEVAVRPTTHIPVEEFDGEVIPYGANQFDAVLLVDVLHHLREPLNLLREATRVARKAIVLKDHVREGLLASETLRFMDWVGNERYGIPLPNTYWTSHEWESAFLSARLSVVEWRSSLRLYPWPVSWLFDRGLHFAALLSPVARSAPGHGEDEEA